MIIKEVKKTKRKNSDSYLYRININKSDNLDNEVAILNLDEYKQLETQLKDKNTTILNKDHEINRLKDKISNLETNIKSINELEENQHETITELNKINNENIDQLTSKHIEEITNINKEHHETINKLTTLNQVLISGLENLQNLGFIDRLSNKNKQIATKLIKENVKKIPTYEVLETKKKK